MKNESDFVAALRALANDPAARGLNDDCAVLEFGGETLVVTHDVLVEGVHVLPGQDPADIAWKLVAVNLSDLAAKGAEPIGLLLGHTLGERDDRFLIGLHEALDRFGVPLLGGDTVASSGARQWGLTALGRATHTPVPSRCDAKAGENVFVTGQIGAALAAFEAMEGGSSEETLAYRRPNPRLAEGRALAPGIGAIMDISDGLLLDAQRMARASGVTIDIDRASVPIALPQDRRDEALRWGDDYELLFTAPSGIGLPVDATRIGRVLPRGESPLLIDGKAPNQDDSLGYRHSTAE